MQLVSTTVSFKEVCVSSNLFSFDLYFQIQVRHMAAGTTGAMFGNEEDGKYSKMWVITSDLPGMGKTRHLQEFAETNHVRDTTFIQLVLCIFWLC